MEPQVWSKGRSFPGDIVIGDRGSVLEAARTWTAGGTIWMDGSRFDSGGACVWERSGEWQGHRFYLGNSKEVFDAEVFAIYQALRVFEPRQESGRPLTIFANSQAAVLRIQSDTVGQASNGPGQLSRPARASWPGAIESPFGGFLLTAGSGQ